MQTGGTVTLDVSVVSAKEPEPAPAGTVDKRM
jgi:hypothetical protein